MSLLPALAMHSKRKTAKRCADIQQATREEERLKGEGTSREKMGAVRACSLSVGKDAKLTE